MAKTQPDLTDDQEACVAEIVAQMRAQLPTPEELQYLRDRKLADERAAWAWQQIRKHAPWVAVVASMVGTGVAYLLTHSIHISGKP